MKTLKHYITKMYTTHLVIALLISLLCGIILLLDPFDRKVIAVEINQLNELEDYKSNQTISYTADHLYYTGVDYLVGDAIRGRYYYALEQGQCYLFLISADRLNDSYKELSNFSITARLLSNDTTNASILASMAESLKFSQDKLNAMTYRYIIDQYNYQNSLATIFTIALSLLGIFAVLDLLYVLFVFIQPQYSMPFYHLRKNGNLKSIYTMACNDFERAEQIRKSSIYMGDFYLFCLTSPANVEIIPIKFF